LFHVLFYANELKPELALRYAACKRACVRAWYLGW
jgi:hypothetical protein